MVKIRIIQNKYLNALFLLMLGSAILHMAILSCKAIIEWDFYVLNYFNILDVPYFFPGFLQSAEGNIIATFFAIAIYVIILKLNDVYRP